MTDPRTNQDLLTEWQQAVDQGLKAWQAISVPQAAAAMQIWQQAMTQGMAAAMRGAQQDGSVSEALTAWKQFMDGSVEAWSKSLDQAMTSEAIATLMGRTLEASLKVFGPLRRNLQGASEEVLRSLNLPSRKQVTRLAASVVALDARMEDLEERLERIEEQLAQFLVQLGRDRGPASAKASPRSAKRGTQKEE